VFGDVSVDELLICGGRHRVDDGQHTALKVSEVV
tara:strand:+ start:114 stop:215 length:102 start_codon:yes stop_codon:yes gene_type:complete